MKGPDLKPIDKRPQNRGLKWKYWKANMISGRS